MTYCDMPDVADNTLKRLIHLVGNNERSFGITVSRTRRLSGDVMMQNGKVKAVVQQRLHPNDVPHAGLKDVGVYVFHNNQGVSFNPAWDP